MPPSGNNAEAVLDIKASPGSFFTDLEKAEKASTALGRSFQAIGASSKQFNAAMAEAGNHLRGLENGLRAFATGARTVGTALTVAVTAPILAAGAAAIKFGMDAVESENLVSVSFGDMRKAAEDWSRDLSKNLGLNEFEMRKTAGTIFNMTTSMGIARDKAFDMSTGVAKLAADMASFRNIPMEEALIKLRAGLTGETEPLKAIGILVDEATVKQEAYRVGLVKTGAELTQQDKVMARWSAILRQTANDQGDLARTMDSPANQLRIMRTRLEEAATALGVSLMPLFQRAVTLLSDLVPHVQSAVRSFSALPDPLKTAAVAIAGITAVAGPAIYVLGGLADAVTKLIPLLRALAATELFGKLGASLAGGGALGLIGVGAVGAAGAITLFNMRMAEMEARAKTASEPVKTLAGDFKYTLEQANKAAEALPKVGEAMTFMGREMNITSAGGSGFGVLSKVLADARKELAELSPEKVRDLTAAIRSGAVDMSDLKRETGLSDTALKLFREQLEAADKAQKKATESLKDLVEAHLDLIDASRKSTVEGAKAVGETLVNTPQHTLEQFTDQFRRAQAAGEDFAKNIAYDIDVTTSEIEDFVPAMAKLGKQTEETSEAMASFGDGMRRVFSGDFKAGFKEMGQSLLDVVNPAAILNTALGNLVSQGLSKLTSFVTKGITAGFKKLFDVEEKQVNKTRQAFVDAAGGLDELHRRAQRAGVTLAELLNARTVDQYTAAVERLNAAFDFQDKAMEDLAATVAKYRFSIEELGPALERQNLDTMAQEIYHDWMVLAAAGIDIAAIAREMGANINDFVQRAVRSGFEVPEAMRPIIEEMIRLGQLTDEAGNKITDINQTGIKFSMSMSDGFRRLITAVDNLTRAIARALGISIDLANQWGAMPPVPTMPGDGGDSGGYAPPAMALGGYYEPRKKTVAVWGEKGREDAVFGGAGRNLAADVAAELARIMPTPSAAHAGATGPRTIVLQVRDRVIGEIAMDDIHAGGDARTKFDLQVQRHRR